MEEELKCPICRRLFTNPIVLPCSHSLCLHCAVSIQVPASQFHGPASGPGGGDSAESVSSGSGSGGSAADYDYLDIDKLSLVSETDSGVVCNTSRPNSYVGTPSIGNLFNLTSLQSAVLGICCPLCKKIMLLDEQGVKSLPKNCVLENIIDKYSETKQLIVKCQMCEDQDPKPAVEMCEQCEVFYCEMCRESCHPSRGPLAKHSLVTPLEGKALLRAKHKNKELKCTEHADETLSMYCVMCRTTVCCACVQDGRHINHDVQPLGATCKAQKTELSQLLQALSEKAKSGTEFIHRLKCMAEHVQENCVEFEASVVAQCDSLIEAVKARRQQLLENVHHEREHKQRVFKEQVSHCTQRLQRTTGLLQFSIEVLKESDPSAFLQVSSPLISRVASVESKFSKQMEFEPRTSPDFELCLDNHSVLHSIQTMNFFQMKDRKGVRCKMRKPTVGGTSSSSASAGAKHPPGAPQIVPDDCSAENNTVTIAWQPHPGSVVDGYGLELDDGNEGDFREVYCGKETICTVEGLHFSSVYNARVKAFNHAGDSGYSECVCLQTADVAWFCLDPMSAHPDMLFSNDNMTVTCNNYDDRVVLGNVGLSKGVHYWEIAIDRYDNTPDPAFGIARFDIAKDKMIGKDDKAWSMYIDSKRSWFMHNSQHTDRTDGGIEPGCVVGVLLDLNQHTLSFYVNEQPHGPVAFVGLHGVFYPAISLNRNVQVSIQTGLNVPADSDTEDE